MAEELKAQSKNGLNRCPKCGATDTKLIKETGLIQCLFCRAQFKGVESNAQGGVGELEGRAVGEGAADIIPGENEILTFKCPACGAEVVINADEANDSRCHWCRHVFSLNEKMPNGAVPDLVLPFKLEKTVAEQKIREFVEKRQFFAHPQFKKEFTTENVMGVYLPYMIVDVNAHSTMSGEAEHQTRRYTVRVNDSTVVYYDADAYAVSRDFDLLVDDLTIEASSDKLNQNVKENTNNVINAVMPFDTENCVEYNAGFLHGFASERRDTNVSGLDKQIELQVGDIARYQMYQDMKNFYDRGEKWTNEQVKVKGSKWKSAYLPVWLYSYRQENNGLLHYVAVNARTGETMGSVPIHKGKLLFVSAIIEIFGIILAFIWFRICLEMDSEDNPILLGLLGFTPGFIFYWLKTKRYRNMDERHTYEKETKATVQNLKKTDNLLENRRRMRNSRIAGENGTRMTGVISKNGPEMMGEKMANFIGIGRSSGSPVNSTPVGQEAELETKKKFGL